MFDSLKNAIRNLDEALELLELSDLSYTRRYTYLLRERRILAKAIKRIEKLEQKYMKPERNTP